MSHEDQERASKLNPTGTPSKSVLFFMLCVVGLFCYGPVTAQSPLSSRWKIYLKPVPLEVSALIEK